MSQQLGLPQLKADGRRAICAKNSMSADGDPTCKYIGLKLCRACPLSCFNRSLRLDASDRPLPYWRTMVPPRIHTDRCTGDPNSHLAICAGRLYCNLENRRRHIRRNRRGRRHPRRSGWRVVLQQPGGPPLLLESDTPRSSTGSTQRNYSCCPSDIVLQSLSYTTGCCSNVREVHLSPEQQSRLLESTKLHVQCLIFRRIVVLQPVQLAA